MNKLLIILLILTFNSISSAGLAEYNVRHKDTQDQYITGYMASLLIHNYGLLPESIAVKNGIIYVKEEKLKGYDAQILISKIKQASSNLKQVDDVVLIKKNEPIEPRIAVIFEKQKLNNENSKDGALINNVLFEPLIADPKWPRFSLAYQYFFSKSQGLKHVFAPNFGASFAIYRAEDKNYEWEFGVQGGLFAIMNIGTDPSALVNADYFIGAPISLRSGKWSGMIRPYHQSSHLGDEFMLSKKGKKVKRINLSFEGIDVIAAYNLEQLRLYGGGGYIVHKEPSYIKREKIQIGAEYNSNITFLSDRLRPVSAIDIKFEANTNWRPSYSCKTGLQLENSQLISNKVQLMLEYYSGKSMHGQFYRNSIRYVGIGLHAFI